MPSTLRQRVADGLGALFRSDVGDRPQTDPLLEVVRHNPGEAAWFLKVVMFFGGCSGVVISVACGAFLSLYWQRCGYCNRPLRWWILVHSVLQLGQVPVRVVFFSRLLTLQANQGGDIYECVRSITCSTAWQVSKHVSRLTYGWFILGVVWLLNSTYCPECPGLYRLCVAVVCSAIARLLITLACFYHSFPRRPREEDPPKPKGASQDLIGMLPLIDYSPDLFDDPGDVSCAVCLNEFHDGDLMRQLPCKHYFHRHCIDKWLRRNQKCPLCMGDIEDTARSSSESHSKLS